MAKKQFIQLSLFDAFASEETPAQENEQKKNKGDINKEKPPIAQSDSEPILPAVNNELPAVSKKLSVTLPANMAKNIINLDDIKQQEKPELGKPNIAPEEGISKDQSVAMPLSSIAIALPKNEVRTDKLVHEPNDSIIEKTAHVEDGQLPIIVTNYTFEDAVKNVSEANDDEVFLIDIEKPKPIIAKRKLATAYAPKPKTVNAQSLQKRGRKSQAQMAEDAKYLNIPLHEELYSKQYYSIGQVAAMFNANVSKIRFWEEQLSNMLKVRKNRKGDRFFTPDNIKTLEQIYMLTSQQGLTMSGAAQYLEHQKTSVHQQDKLLANLQELKSFLLALQAGLS